MDTGFVKEKRGINLVLSSGGARGIAQIAVIEELQKKGFEINSIAGSSIGAVVGGVYACGYMPQYKAWVRSLSKFDVFRLLDISISKQGFIRGDRVFRAMEEFIPDCAIEELPLHYTAVATDLGNKKEYLFRSGSLFKAMRASISIPTVMQPVRYDGLTLIDGGVLNPLPITCVRRDPDDLLVVVNVNAAIPYEPIQISEKVDLPVVTKEEETGNESALNVQFELMKRKVKSLFPSSEDGTGNSKKEANKTPGFFDLMVESIELMQDKMTSLIVEDHQPDLTINISKDAASTFEFYRAEELLAQGRIAFEKAMIEANLP